MLIILIYSGGKMADDDDVVVVASSFCIFLTNKAGYYVSVLWFLLLLLILLILFFFFFFLFPRLISAVTDWMSTIAYFFTWCGLSANLECRAEMCCMPLAGNTGRKNDAKNRHLLTTAQVCWAVSSQLRHVSTIEKNFFNINISPHVPGC